MKKIAIIGGGVSGVAAAVKLLGNTNDNNTNDNNSNDNKFEVTLFEAKSNLGGRINSFIDAKSGDTIDNGQHIAIGAYINFFDLLNRLETFKYLYAQNCLEIEYLVNKQFYKLKSSDNKIAKLLDLDLAIGLINFKLLNLKDKIQIIKFALNLKFRINYLKSIIKLKKINNVLDFFKCDISSIHQTENSIKYFWEPLCIATLNTSINEASISVFLEVLRQGFFAGSELSKIYFSQIGLADLLKPLENYSKYNYHLKLNTSIKKVEYEKTTSKVNIYNQNNELFEFDYVISALNYDVFLKLFKDNFENDDKKILNLNQLQSSPILSIYLWLDIDFIKFPIVSMPSSILQWVFNKRMIDKRKIDNLASENQFSKGFYCVTISTADKILVNGIESNLMEKSNNEIIELVLNELKIHLPDAEHIVEIKSHLLHYRVIKENKATFLCTEEIHNYRESNSQLNDWLYIAGDWVKNDFPSTIEGSVINGYKAANLMLQKLHK